VGILAKLKPDLASALLAVEKAETGSNIMQINSKTVLYEKVMVASTARIREHESSLKGSSPAEEEEKATTQKKMFPRALELERTLPTRKKPGYDYCTVKPWNSIIFCALLVII
jgi:hypothetical protein